MPRVVIRLSDYDLLQACLMEAVPLVESADLVALTELLPAGLTVVAALEFCLGRADLVV